MVTNSEMFSFATGIIAGYGIVSYAARTTGWLHKSDVELRSKLLDGAFCHRDCPLVVAHRAGGGEAPENTIAAMRSAVDAGAELLQVDATLSKDGVAVMIHDDPREKTLERMTGKQGNIRDTLAKHIPPLLPTTTASPLCGEVSLTTSRFGAEARIATLEEFLQAAAGAGPGGRAAAVQLELWDDDERLVEQAAALLRRTGMHRHAIVGHPFDAAINLKCSQHMPEIPQILTFREILKIYMYYYTGILPFVDLPEERVFNCMQVTKGISRLVRQLSSKPAWIITPILWAAKHFLHAPGLYSHLRMRGVPTIVFVLNDPSDWHRGLACGADAIMTDFPLQCSRWQAGLKSTNLGR